MSFLRKITGQPLLFALLTFASSSFTFARADSPGRVYTLNNATDANHIVAYNRDAKGGLSAAATYPTGGKGLGTNLGSQGALALSGNGRWLVAVNAGSNELSVFSVRPDSLVLTDVASSGGRRPISVTIEDNLVYVLNAGGSSGWIDSITGFFLSEEGHLVAVPGSTRPLSAGDVGPAQISFGLGGDVLVVTEKNSSRLCGFPVDDQGRAGPSITTPSAGATPFGFGVSSKGYIFVSEAPGSALSSYQLHADGSLSLVTGSAPNYQAAACWAIVSKNEKFAYTANAGSNTISAYKIAHDGTVELLSSSGFAAAAGVHPIDLAVSNDGRFLYSLSNVSGTIVGYRLNEDGSLVRVTEIGGLPSSTVGVVVR